MDRYRSFEQLDKHEGTRAYRIEHEKRASGVCVIAPHGGKIEHGTSEIVRAVAGTQRSFYLFEGLKRSNNRYLHLTSTNFDEPSALVLIENSNIVLAIHGCEGVKEAIFVGGRHKKLADSITAALTKRGFSAGKHDNPSLQGTHEDNICNRGKLKLGVQFEITSSLRKRLVNEAYKNESPSIKDFVDAIEEGFSALGLPF